jgi:hypothetical protein
MTSEARDKIDEISKKIEDAATKNLNVAPVLDGCAPTDLAYVVMNGGKQICWTKNLEDAHYVIASVKGAARLTALTLSVMLGWKPDKNEEVRHGI